MMFEVFVQFQMMIYRIVVIPCFVKISRFAKIPGIEPVPAFQEAAFALFQRKAATARRRLAGRPDMM